MNTAQRIIKNTVSLLTGSVIAGFLHFIVIVYLARVLGPGGFGEISFAMAIVIYFTLIADLGLPLLGTREVAREKDKIKDYLGSILTLRLLLALIGFGLLVLMTFFLNKPVEIRYLIILYGLGLIPSALLLDWAFQGMEKMEYIGLGRILSGVVYLGLVLGFVKTPNQLLLIPCFQVAGNLLAAGLLISIFVKNFGLPKFRVNFVLWKKLIHQALPIGLSLVMVQIIYYADTVMLGFMRSSEEVGYYNAAYKIIFVFILILGAYYNAVFPVISNYFKTSLHLLKKLQSYTIKLMVTVVVPLAVGGTILAKPVMNFLYGAEYASGAIALQILIWALVLICINSVYAWGLWACDGQNKYLRVVTVQAVSNVVLNFILIPFFGLIGASVATVMAELIGVPFYYKEFNKIVQVPFYNYIVKSLLASGAMALFLYGGLNWLDLSVFLLTLGGVLIYFAFLYLMRGITKEEVRLIQSVILGIK